MCSFEYFPPVSFVSVQSLTIWFTYFWHFKHHLGSIDVLNWHEQERKPTQNQHKPTVTGSMNAYLKCKYASLLFCIFEHISALIKQCIFEIAYSQVIMTTHSVLQMCCIFFQGYFSADMCSKIQNNKLAYLHLRYALMLPVSESQSICGFDLSYPTISINC